MIFFKRRPNSTSFEIVHGEIKFLQALQLAFYSYATPYELALIKYHLKLKINPSYEPVRRRP